MLARARQQQECSSIDGTLGSVYARSVPNFVLPRMSVCMRRADTSPRMSGGGQELHPLSRVPALRRLSGALLTMAVLLAGGALTWVAARSAIDSEKQRARAELRL